MHSNTLRCLRAPSSYGVMRDTEEAVLVRGKRQFLYDDSGASYLDCVNSVAHVGHCNPRVEEVTHRVFSSLTPVEYHQDHAPPSSSSSSYVDMIKSTLPPHLDTVLSCDSGTEAVDLAVRLSRLWCSRSSCEVKQEPGSGPRHRRGDVVVVEGSFHGCSNSVRHLSHHLKTATDDEEQSTHVVPLPDVYRVTPADVAASPADRGVSSAVNRHLYATRQMLNGVLMADRKVACFICEPLLTLQGTLCPPPSWLQGLYSMVREMFGALCIADEVQSGMGRLGEHFWGFQSNGVTPDIVIAGKSLGNGFPMAMVITSKAIADTLGPLKEMYGCSSIHNSIGSAVLEVISSESMAETAVVTGQHLKRLLLALKKKHPYVGDVRGVGLLHAVEIVWSQEEKAPSREIAEFIIYRLRLKGVIMTRTGVHKNVLMIMPPMPFDELDTAALAAKLDEALTLVAFNFAKKFGQCKEGDGGQQSPDNSPGNERRRGDNARRGVAAAGHLLQHREAQQRQPDVRGAAGQGGPGARDDHEAWPHERSRNEGRSSEMNGGNHSNRCWDRGGSGSSSYPSSSSSNNNSSDDDSRGGSSGNCTNRTDKRDNIFANIVFVERHTQQTLLNELENSTNLSTESPYYDLKNNSSKLHWDTELHPNERHRMCGVAEYGPGMVQPQAMHNARPSFCGLFPYDMDPE